MFDLDTTANKLVVDYWEFVIDDEEGSQVILRMSETTTRSLVRRIHELIGDVLA